MDYHNLNFEAIEQLLRTGMSMPEPTLPNQSHSCYSLRTVSAFIPDITTNTSCPAIPSIEAVSGDYSTVSGFAPPEWDVKTIWQTGAALWNLVRMLIEKINAPRSLSQSNHVPIINPKEDQPLGTRHQQRYLKIPELTRN